MNKTLLCLVALLFLVGTAKAQGPWERFYDDSVVIGYSSTQSADSLDSTRGWRDTASVVLSMHNIVSDTIFISIKSDSITRKVVVEWQPVLLTRVGFPQQDSVVDTLALYSTITWTAGNLGTTTDTVTGQDTLYWAHIWRDWGDGQRVIFRTTLADSTTADSLTQSAQFNVEVRGQRSN